jgi:heptosyltransferase-2
MQMRSETIVIGLNWVGDNILALPTYRALQNRFRKDGGISVAAPEHIASLLASMGGFRQVVAWNGSTAQRIRSLRARQFRRAIILPNSFRAAMIAFAAGIEERWGFPTDGRGFLLTHQVPKLSIRGHQLEDYTPLLDALEAPLADDIPSFTLPVGVLDKAKRKLRALGIRPDRQPLFGIHAGGFFGHAKHWGDKRFGEVAERLRHDGYDVVLLTSPSEREQAERIASACRIPVIGHDGDVLQLAAAIAQCSLVITNDSGPLHLATALAVPSVSIFGPTDPGRTIIPGASRVVHKLLACSPCYRRECPLRHHRCMNEIGVDDVYEAAIGLLHEMEGKVVAAAAAKVRV